jgi:polyphosphate kinase
MLMRLMTAKTAARVPLLNRELGILAFNRRVLAQAVDESVPLLERLRFLTIVSSNLDEFFEIRVAGIKEQIKLGISDPGPDGTDAEGDARNRLPGGARSRHEAVRSPERRAAAAARGLRHSLPEARHLERRAARLGPRLLHARGPPGPDSDRSRSFTPVPARLQQEPEPHRRAGGARRLRAQLARRHRAGAAGAAARHPLPAAIAGSEYSFVYLTSVLHAHIDELFAGMTVKGCYQFRVTRNSDLFVDEEEIKNLRIALQGELMQRHFGDAVRLEVVEESSPAMIDFLLQQFQLAEQDLYHTDGPVNLYRLREVLTEIDRPDLKYPAFSPSVPAAIEMGDDDLFQTIARQDILLHHPYQSFTARARLHRSSATDPRVIAIKQTVYRTGATSELMQILLDAARAGKEVTVVVELLRTLRRGGEPQLGRAARGRRRARDLRRRRPQDAREDGADRAARAGPGGHGAEALCAPRHRQLSLCDVAALHGLGPSHRQR